MSDYVDNLIAFKILYSLVTPFEKTEAYKQGVIDKDGNVLVRSKDQTQEQKNSYNMLDRLAFSLKRIIGKLPGGKSQIASLAAAYYLVKECYDSKTKLNEHRVKHIMGLVEDGITLVEEEILVEKFLKLKEDGEAISTSAIANKTGPSVSTDQPVISIKKKRKPDSSVDEPIFRRTEPK